MLGHHAAGVFGYSHLTGGFAGGQAEYARVPFADVGPLRVPDSLTDEQVLFLSDILPTAYMGAEMCDIQPGDVKTEILRRTRNVESPVASAYEPNLSRARDAEATKEGAAIDAQRVARLVLDLLDARNPPPRIIIGNLFEQWIAPLGARLLPRRAIELGQKLTYNLRDARD